MNTLDELIRKELPNYTCVDFCKKFNPGVGPRNIGQRARSLGVNPKKYAPTEFHKQKTSIGLRKKFDDQIYEYIKGNLNKISRIDISRNLGISLYHVNTIINEENLEVDSNFTKHICSEKSKKHVKKATEASKHKWSDKDFSSRMKQEISKRSEQLWKNDIYRLKVIGSIKKTYCETDFADRLSVIGKERYQNDPKVREILHADRQFKNSKLNDLIAQKLDSFEIKYEREFRIANYKFDFKIGNILFEVNGDYWHSIPENKSNDLAKATIINTYYPEYQIRVMWESEIKSIKCNDRLLEILGVNQIIPIPIDLNNLVFVTDPDLDKFLASFHYLGSTNRKKYKYGMTLYNNLICVATFGSPIRPNIATGKVIELTRLCRHPKFFNKNLLSFFLTQCIKEIKKLGLYDNVVSFADLRLHSGSIYKATNWVDMGDTSPDYNYMSDDNIPMHKKTLYNRAIRDNMTEREYAELHGFRKIKIGSKRKFLFPLIK
jgi:hypothetical protein